MSSGVRAPRLPTGKTVPESDATGPRVLYLGGIDLPMRQARAIQVLHTAHALAVQGCQVTLVVGRLRADRLTEVLGAYGLASHENLTLLSVPALRLPSFKLAAYVHPRLAVWNWSYGMAALLATRILPAQRRPGVVLARDPRLAHLFLQARPLTCAPVIYEVHELFSSRAREPMEQADPRALARSPRVRGLEEAVFRKAYRLITLTHACRKLLIQDFHVPPERVLVAPDAVAAVPTDLPPRQASTLTVVYAGHLYPWKGVGTAVRALKHTPDLRLKIIGGLSPQHPDLRALQILAIEEGVADRIEFTGFLPHARVASTLSGALAGVLPLPDNPMARHFTSPLKLFEYMAAGVPIIASDLPSIREVLHHDVNALLVPPDDSAALAEALQRLQTEPALADRLRAHAHRDVRGRTWAARAASILPALRATADRRSYSSRAARV